MVVLIALALVLVGTLWSYVHGLTAGQAVVTVLLMVFRDFLLASAVVATVLWCVWVEHRVAARPCPFRPDTPSSSCRLLQVHRQQTALVARLALVAFRCPSRVGVRL